MDAYKVGVKLVMSLQGLPMLAALSKELTGINVKVNQLTGGFSKLKVAIGSAAALWAGDKILGGLVSIIDKTKELSHELTQVRKLGGQSEADVSAVYNNALKVGKSVRGISYADTIRIYSEVFDTVGGNKQEALDLMGPLAKFDVVAGNTLGKFGQSMDPNFNRDLIKGAEQLGWLTDKNGNLDLKRFAEYEDMVNKLMTASHGQINPATMRAEATTGSTGLMTMDKQSLMLSAILGQYMGPSRVGTATQSLFSQFGGGVMFSRNAEAMERIGLLGQDEWKKGGGGRVVLTPDAQKRLGGLASNPVELIQTLKRDMVAHGITDQNEQIKELFAIFGRQTTQRYASDIMQNLKQMLNALVVVDKAQGVGEGYQTQQTYDVEQKQKDFQIAWDRFLNVLVGPKNEVAITVLNKLTDVIERLTDATAKMNPDTLKNLAIGVSILGTALVGGGAVAIAAMFGPVGWLAAGVIGIGAAVAVWGPKILDYLGVGGRLVHSIINLGSALAGYDWKGGFDSLISGMQSLWDRLKGWMHGDSGIQPGQLSYTGDGNGLLHRISYGPAGMGGSASTGGGATARGVGGSSSTGGGAGNLAMGGGDVNAALAVGAAAAGVDVAHFKAMASIESSLNPTSNWNRGTQYKGLFQIGRSEWAKFGHGSIYNAHDNAMAMAGLVNANKAIFRKRFGRDPTPDEIYLMHQQGAGFFLNGAMTNIGGNPYPGMHGPQSHNSFLNGWSAEVERRAHRFGGSAIPKPKDSGGVLINQPILLDGQVVARNVVKRITGRGNMVASGGRMTDTQISRPISI